MPPPQRVFALPRQQSLLLPEVLNPFVLDLKLSKGDKIKFVLLGFLLVPLRTICMVLVLLVTWPIAAIVTLGQPLKGAVEPMAGWRRFLCRVVISSLGQLYYLAMGFRVVVKGQQVSSAQAPILVVAPHSSFFDGIVCIVAGLPSTVSRTETLFVPIFGRFLRCLQPVLVSRVDPDSRKNTILEIEKRSTSGGHWPQVLIFPEGTCTNRSCLITFKQGAFIPGVPVQPVLLKYPNKLDTISWTWQGPHQWLMVNKTVKVISLSQMNQSRKLVPTEDEKKSPSLFANRVRALMAQELGLPVTDHTYEDCRLMISAGELTLPMETGLVEFTKISKKLNLKWDNVRKELESFSAIASSCKGGRIKIEEFASFLKLPVSPALQELFALFDRDGNGTIDFREYVIGVTVLCRPANTEEVIQMAFKLFDTDEDQSITQEEFSSLLRSALGVSDLNVSSLFREIDTDGSGHITYSEFESFALSHPEYAKLFTTYLELQRYYALQEAELDSICSSCSSEDLRSEDNQEGSTSDKKED
uniref:EF-hand domain-containing protein n=1 Tax=Denticeps clupeoides TaxID=299321 RepID=A0AAY4F0A6_9TELE